MIRHFAIAAVTLLGVSFFSGRADAQVFAPGAGGGSHSVGRPTVSPYTNLPLADGLAQLGIPGGYQTLVRPFIDGRRAANANSAAISRLQSQIAAGAVSGGGRPAGPGFYLNYSHYYPGMAAPAR